MSPEFHLPQNPAPDVISIEAFVLEPTRLSDVKMFAFVLGQGTCFWLRNSSALPIVGLAVRWVYVDSEGKQTSDTLSQDALSDERQQPVVAPGSRTLVTTLGIVPDWVLFGDKGFCGGLAGSGLMDDRRVVEAQLDCIILGDGELIGPDESGLVAHIERKSFTALPKFFRRPRA